MLVVYHIPKTAGTTLRRFIWKHVPENRRHAIGDDILRDFAKIKAYGFEGIDVLFGHVCYGMVPLDGTLSVTMLREPLQRVRSLYDYIRNDELHYLHERVVKQSFENFLQRPFTCTADNAMVRQLCGYDVFRKYADQDMRIPIGGVTREHLESAKENLLTFALVGLAARYANFQHQLAAMFGWSSNDVEVYNYTHPQLRTDVSKYNGTDYSVLTLDYELYEFARGIAA